MCEEKSREGKGEGCMGMRGGEAVKDCLGGGKGVKRVRVATREGGKTVRVDAGQ